jgi:hypothetical protein
MRQLIINTIDNPLLLLSNGRRPRKWRWDIVYMPFLSDDLVLNIRSRRTLFPKAFTEKCSFVACSLRSPLRVFLDLRSRFHDVPAHMRLLLLSSLVRASRNPSCKRPFLQLRARHPTSPNLSLLRRPYPTCSERARSFISNSVVFLILFQIQ